MAGGNLRDGSYYAHKSCCGGGAGSVSGAGYKSDGAKSTQNGECGTGGLLVVYSEKLVINSGSLFSAVGSKGGSCVGGGGSGDTGSAAAGGGGSGGGSINVFAKEISINSGNVSSNVRVSGGAGRNGIWSNL